MARNVKLLMTVCLLAIAGVIVLQFYWVKNYYETSLFNFGREVNLAFEDAVKKDFELRNDTIEQLLIEQLMDTSMFQINSTKGRTEDGSMKFTVYETQNKKDSWTFSPTGFTDSLVKSDLNYKRKVAKHFAKGLRTEDLENHVVYYRTQNLGHFMMDQIKEYGFDTIRLRPVFQNYLNKRHIHTPFYFHVSKADSTLNNLILSDSLSHAKMVVTKAFSTYKWWTYEERYVRAVFENPMGYVFTQMKWMLTGSLLLTVSVALCIWLLFKALFHEKKISTIKNDFINNITHELKTPVATISAAIEAVLDFDLNKEQRSRYLNHAKNETRRLARLVDRILNISLYDKHKIPIQTEPIDIKDTIHKIADSLIMASDKKIRLQYVNNTGIDSISVDKQLFQQTLTNILENAIKYSGKDVDITISCQVHNPYFCIQCVDNGEGIAPSSMPYIFERFYREPKRHHAIKGYGLGLSYVKEIMGAHDGKIEIHSTKEKGTTVILSWPI